MYTSVAVLICVYDGDDLQQFDLALKSVVNQEGVNARIYLHVDGCVSKKFEHYLDKQSKIIYKVVRSEHNVGLSKGLNKLIHLLEDEEFVFRMDADDISCPGRFIRQIEYLNSNISVDACGGGIQEFLSEPANVVFTRCYPLSHEDIVKVIHKASPLAHVTMCFKSSFFIRFGDYPVNCPFNEDIAFWFESLKKGAVFGNLDMNLVKVRMDGAYSRRSISKAWPEFKVYMKIAMWKRKLPLWAMVRLIFRLMPPRLVQKVYSSRLRTSAVK